jgi:hypothetical protein
MSEPGVKNRRTNAEGLPAWAAHKAARTEVEAAERVVVRLAMEWWRADPRQFKDLHEAELRLRVACSDYDRAKTWLAKAKEDARR